ncbi:MAG: hypothetical protein IVW57_07245 [Ktedonobacterales bacterium]|nr:hypothetical protein [Ktedonobacterales bacterium]
MSMVARALAFPLGRPMVPMAIIRRRRDLPADAQIRVRLGERVQADQPIAEASGPAGRFTVIAGLAGTIADTSASAITIEGAAAIIQGMVGLGGAVAGPIFLIPPGESPALVPIQRGAIIVHPQRLPLTLLQRAATGGAAGIITGSASALELEGFARTDLSALLDGLIPDLSPFPLTVMLTAGLGDLPMQPAMYTLLAQRAGTMALLSGMTQPRHNLRPEVLLAPPPSARPITLPAESALVLGARVRVSAGQYQGAEGEIAYLFTHPQPSETGQPLPTARLRLENGNFCALPLALLDRVG